MENNIKYYKRIKYLNVDDFSKRRLFLGHFIHIWSWWPIYGTLP
jgi:hypothetical protein